jgi:hypothetical protein
MLLWCPICGASVDADKTQFPNYLSAEHFEVVPSSVVHAAEADDDKVDRVCHEAVVQNDHGQQGHDCNLVCVCIYVSMYMCVYTRPRLQFSVCVFVCIYESVCVCL